MKALQPQGESKVVPVLNQVPRHEDVWTPGGIASHIFLTSALDGGEWSASRPGTSGRVTLNI